MWSQKVDGLVSIYYRAKSLKKSWLCILFYLGCGYSKVVESSDFHGGYPASNVLIDSCDDMAHPVKHSTGEPSMPVVDWWIGADGGTDTDAEFVLQLACEKMVDRVMLKNTANGVYKDRWVV